MTTNVAWHKAQAKRIKDTEGNLSMYWWAVGEKLNEEFGFTVGRGSWAAGRMSKDDTEYFSCIYSINTRTLQDARKFHKMCPDEIAARGVVHEYGNWARVHSGFLPGRSANEENPSDRSNNARRAYSKSGIALLTYARDQLGYADKAAARELVQDYMSDTEWFRKFAEEMG